MTEAEINAKQQRLEYELQEANIKYNQLLSEVRKMMDAQEAYFKSNKDKAKLAIAKNQEKKVKELICLKPVSKVSQGYMDFLAS